MFSKKQFTHMPVPRGIEDHVYVNFFGVEGNAAMLACDQCGVVPEDVLYVPKSYFLRAAASEQDKRLATVRYVMVERARQGTLRRLLSEKNRIIREGNVEKVWRVRNQLDPHALPRPKFSRKQLKAAAEAYDTDNDDAEDNIIDEKGLLKPPLSIGPGAPDVPSSPSPVEVAVHVEDAPPAKENPVATPENAFPLLVETDDLVQETVACDESLHVPTAAPPAMTQGGISSLPMGIYCLNKLPPPRRPPSLPLPPLAHFPRTMEGIPLEERELADYRNHLARHAFKAPTQSMKYSQYKEMQAAKEAARIQALEEDLHWRRSQLRASVYSQDESEYEETTEVKDGVNGQRAESSSTQSSSSDSDRSNSEPREINIARRVALLRLHQTECCFKMGRKIDREMDAFPQLGTVAHTIKSKENIGRPINIAQRIAVDKLRSKAAQKNKLEELGAQVQSEKASTNRMKRADTRLERVKDGKRGLLKTVNMTRSEIVHHHREMVQRMREKELAKCTAKNARKHRHAKQYNEFHAVNGNLKRYEHDQVAMFRRDLRTAMGRMDMQKNWDAEVIQKL